MLDAEKKRLARGRYDLAPEGGGATFLPTSTVSEEQMQAVAFLWPDGEEMVTVAAIRPGEPGELRFHLTLAK